MIVFLHTESDTVNFLPVRQPAGLLLFLESHEQSPSRDVDRLHVRDNLQMANEAAESDKGSAVLRAAGKGLKQGKQIASKTAEVVGEKTIKYTEEAWKAAEKHMETALMHWRTKMGEEWLKSLKNSNEATSAASAAAAKKSQAEKLIVLRKRRQRVRTKVNWSLFYHMFNQDHAQPNLIWNFKTRQELKDALEAEIQSFVQDRELSQGSLMSWNYNEFEVFHCNALLCS